MLRATKRLLAQARAFFDFYRINPRDLDLGFYLFHGIGPRGLTRQLDERLNARLHDALSGLREALQAHGLERLAAQREMTGLFAHSVGLLVLFHSGRLRMFNQDVTALFEDYLKALEQRLPAQPAAPIAVASS